MATYAKSAKTREHVFRTAIDLFAQNGYQETSLRDIAKAADVSTRTLYRYFPSKSDLLFYIRRNSQEHLRSLIENLSDDMSLVDKLCTVMRADQDSVSYGMDLDGNPEVDKPHQELALTVRRESYGSIDQLRQEEEFRAELQSIYRRIIEQAQSCGELDSSLDAQGLSEVVSALYFQAIDKSILRSEFDVTETVRPKLKMIFHA